MASNGFKRLLFPVNFERVMFPALFCKITAIKNIHSLNSSCVFKYCFMGNYINFLKNEPKVSKLNDGSVEILYSTVLLLYVFENVYNKGF